MITTVITSCNRHDLLKRTLDSYFKHVTEIDKLIIVEDGPTDLGWVRHLYPDKNIKLLHHEKRRGQIEAIDWAYTLVDTPYINHGEDDFIYTNGNFVLGSVYLLKHFPEVCMVGLRGLEDTMTQPVLKDRPYLYLDPTYKGHWHGFRFNPGLRRKSDWEKLGGYSSVTKFNFDSPADSEIEVAMAYYQMGMVAALLPEKFVEHIGRHRHVEAPKQMI